MQRGDRRRKGRQVGSVSIRPAELVEEGVARVAVPEADEGERRRPVADLAKEASTRSPAPRGASAEEVGGKAAEEPGRRAEAADGDGDVEERAAGEGLEDARRPRRAAANRSGPRRRRRSSPVSVIGRGAFLAGEATQSNGAGRVGEGAPAPSPAERPTADPGRSGGGGARWARRARSGAPSTASRSTLPRAGKGLPAASSAVRQLVHRGDQRQAGQCEQHQDDAAEGGLADPLVEARAENSTG